MLPKTNNGQKTENQSPKKEIEHANADLQGSLGGDAECNNSRRTIEQTFCFGLQLKRVY